MNAMDSFSRKKKQKQKNSSITQLYKCFLLKEKSLIIWRESKINKILLLEWRDLNIFLGIDDEKEKKEI